MKIDAVDAKARFDNTAFSNEIINGRALPLTATYTCPQCGERLGFNRQDFECRAERRFSNLSPTMQRCFNEWAFQNGQSRNPFLDWTCPNCGLAVRAYVHPWAGGRHGDSGVKLTIILEAEEHA